MNSAFDLKLQRIVANADRALRELSDGFPLADVLQRTERRARNETEGRRALRRLSNQPWR